MDICCVGKNSCLPVLANGKAGANKHCSPDSLGCFCLPFSLRYPYLILVLIFYSLSIVFSQVALLLYRQVACKDIVLQSHSSTAQQLSLSLGSTRPNTIIIGIIDNQASLRHPFSGAMANTEQTNAELQHYGADIELASTPLKVHHSVFFVDCLFFKCIEEG